MNKIIIFLISFFLLSIHIITIYHLFINIPYHLSINILYHYYYVSQLQNFFNYKRILKKKEGRKKII